MKACDIKFLLFGLAMFFIQKSYSQRPDVKPLRFANGISTNQSLGSDCSSALPVCASYTVDSMPVNASAQVPACFTGAIVQDFWIQFSVTGSGVLAWKGIPLDLTDEFDWALWDISAGCPGSEVCCNYNYTNGGSQLGFGMQAQSGTVSCGFNGFANDLAEFCPPINVTAGQTYALQVSNYFGDNKGFSISFINSTCQINSPAISVNSPTICSGVSATLTATGGSSYTWAPGGATGASIVVTPTVNTTYTVTGSNGCPGTSNAIANVTVNQCLVWPGDADNDLTATQADLLPIGIHYGATGPLRPGANNNWTGQACSDWGQTQGNGNDVKYADCNGDGVIDFNDTLAIHLNFGQNHPPKGNLSALANSDLYFIFDQASYIPGDTVNADLYLGSATNVKNNFYGAAFDINYDASIIVPGSEKYWFVNSWVGGINSSKITFSKINSGIGEIDAAMVKITHNDTSGFGKIGVLQFVLTNTVQPSQLYLSTFNAIQTNSAGSTGSLTSTTDSVAIVSGTTAVNSFFSKEHIRIFPNPTNGNLTVDIPNAKETIYQVEVQNALGQVVFIDKWIAVSGTVNRTISLMGRNKGVYAVIIQNAKAKSVHKVVLE